MAKKYQDIEKDIELRKRLLGLGICSSCIGPRGLKGDKGDQGEQGIQGEIGPAGPPGPVAGSSTDGLFFTGFIDEETSSSMTFDGTWLIPEPSEYFKLSGDDEVELQPGVYQITLSGLISEADDTHGATVYLSSLDGSAIKDLSFSLLAGNGKQMYFSQTTIIRFEKETSLQVVVSILGDENTSNVVISDVNLLIKKIHIE